MPRHLGDLDQLVLLALASLGDQAYGIVIRDAIVEDGGREVTVGAVYKALWRLEARGLIASHEGTPTARRGGRRTRLYQLEREGRRALTASLDAVARLTRDVPGLASR